MSNIFRSRRSFRSHFLLRNHLVSKGLPNISNSPEVQDLLRRCPTQILSQPFWLRSHYFSQDLPNIRNSREVQDQLRAVKDFQVTRSLRGSDRRRFQVTHGHWQPFSPRNHFVSEDFQTLNITGPEYKISSEESNISLDTGECVFFNFHTHSFKDQPGSTRSA